MSLLLLRKQNLRKKCIYYLLEQERRFHSYGSPFKFQDVSNGECKKLFRFSKTDIDQLRVLLKLPVKISCGNRLTVLGVDGLCMLLRRLSYPNRLFDLQMLFKKELSEISRVINFVLDHIYDNFGHLLKMADKPWMSVESLMEYCNAIRKKGAPLSTCWGFIDGTVRPMCRPNKHQKECYNGHKRHHALKYQSILAPNGLIVDLYGPIEGRRHDAFMLSESKVSDILKEFKNESGEQLCIYGDPAYPLRPWLIGPYKGSRITTQELIFNKKMSKVRISVEWAFGNVISKFAFVDFKKNQKLFTQPLAKYFKVAVILTNCHLCLYGSNISTFFQVDPPSLEEYLQS